MKSKFLLTFSVLAFLSCQTKTENRPNEFANLSGTDAKIKTIPTNKIEVVTYENCEYLIYKDKQTPIQVMA